MVTDRKRIYLGWINANLPRILEFQDLREGQETRGCFFYPGWRGDAGHFNARWQEAVLSLAWAYKRKPDDELLERIRSGIDFWCGIQNKDGSLPEYVEGERSFSATAFSTFAVSEAARIVGVEKRWESSFSKAGDWLCRNDETVLINQQSAAMMALMNLYKMTRSKRFMAGSERKKRSVLSAQSPDGWFSEKRGPDLSYSSLALEMLGLWNKEHRCSEILDAAKKYFRFLKEFIFRDGTFGGAYNSRTAGWIILDSMELFPKIPEAGAVLHMLLECHRRGVGNVQHLPDERHLCTDLYRICFAYDNASSKLERAAPGGAGRKEFKGSDLLINRKKSYTAITDASLNRIYSLWASGGIRMFIDDFQGGYNPHAMKFLRRIGMHKFRRLWYLVPRPHKKRDRRVILLDNGLEVHAKSQDSLLLSYTRKCSVDRNGDSVQLTDGSGKIGIKARGAKITITDHRTVPVKDSMFYGGTSLGFVVVGFSPLANSYKYTLTFS